MAFNPATTPRSNARGGDRCIIGTAPRWPTRAHGARGACMGTDASMMQTAHSSGKVRSDTRVVMGCLCWANTWLRPEPRGRAQETAYLRAGLAHACLRWAGAQDTSSRGARSGRFGSCERPPCFNAASLCDCLSARGGLVVNAGEQAQWRHPFTEIHSFGWQRCVLSCPPEREASRLS